MIVIHADTVSFARDLSKIQRDQLPFASALALNKTAKRVVEVETSALSETFQNPRAFTKSAFTQASTFGGMYATKKLPIAIVVAKPIQARYLAPSEGPKEPQVKWRGFRSIATPVGVKVTAGGDIPRGTIKKLLMRPDVFMAEIRGIDGIWQRPNRGVRRAGGYGTKGKHQKGGVGTLKLLIAFTRPVQIRTDLHYAERARAEIDANWAADLDASLDKALATAKK